MFVFERALPLALTVFCGVVGGIYTFQPIFAPDAQKKIQPTKSTERNTEQFKESTPVTK
ncbi:uncharacterized protein FTOL_10060 [Fusarium torulosum]|uniref:Uncharacterized protein n=1 Tax=Fusarium torulosum TaxID=33205 RepID=A0AAE8SLJ1_9HYPO|nr:uncharacterized protein FTOL_10060 [Fusarium torulosum]